MIFRRSAELLLANEKKPAHSWNARKNRWRHGAL